MKKIIEQIKEKSKSKTFVNILIVTISYLATYFIPYVISFKEELTYSNSIISVVVFVAFVWLLKKTFIKENIDKLKNIFSLGMIFSTFLVLRK